MNSLTRRFAYTGLLVGVVVIANGCGDRPAPPSVAVSTPSRAEVEDARRFRESFGLRADETWIFMVAGDPSSQRGRLLFGVPLLPAELTELLDRTKAYTDASPVILDYAATVPDDWYGLYIDQQRGGIIVAQFFRNTEHHREVLARLLPPSARWEVRQVDQRTLDMLAFVTRVKADRAWFRTIEAELLDVVASPLEEGYVELTYLANSRVLDGVIREHYGGPEWLRVQRAGRLGPWEGPVGNLVVKAVGRDGAPVPGLTCSLGNPPLLTDHDGVCRYRDLAAITYQVELWSGIEESRRVAGAATAIVTPNRTTTITIVVR